MQLPIYVGYDPMETVAFHVFCSSVIRRKRKSLDVQFIPLCGDQENASNTFSRIRFEIPARQRFNGLALWADGDMLCRTDIGELLDQYETGFDVMLVKHNYSTKHPVKYLGQNNDDYPRKNWSSLMLMQCGNYPWRKLSPEYVKTAKMSNLHRLEFLKDERIGDLDKEWNHLVSEYEPNPNAKLAHFTIGIPPFYPQCEFASEWWNEMKQMTHHEHWDSTALVSER